MQLNNYLPILALAAMLTVNGPALADTTLTVGSVSGSIGAQIDIPITMSNPAYTAGASFTVTYDTSALQLDELNSDFFPLFISMGISDADPFIYEGDEYYRAVLGREVPTGAMITGVRTTVGAAETILFTLRFTILAGATEPTYQINLGPSVISLTDAGYAPGGEPIPMLIGISGDTFPEEPVMGITPGTVTIIPADTDGDSIPDEWERDNLPPGIDPYSPEALDVFSAAGDYDHDGYTDLQEYLNGTDPRLMNAPGGPGYDGSSDKRISTNDFNGDGLSDILVRRGASGQVLMLIMDGYTILESGSPGSVDDTYVFERVGDFNSDGKSDLLIRRTTSGQVTFLMMDGSAILPDSGSPGSVDDTYVFEGVGDFNGDGNSDLIVRRSTDGQVTVYMMDGYSVLPASGSPGSVDDTYEFEGIGDFNSDGKSDLVVRRSTDGQVTIYMMDGQSVLPDSGSPGSFDDTYVFEGVGDFNGDGNSDLLVRRSTDDEVLIWMMDGYTILPESGSPGYLEDSYVIEGVGDYNGDGMSDVLLHRTTDSHLLIWMMDGITILPESGSPGYLDDTDVIEGL